MTISPDAQGWYALERDIELCAVEQLRQAGPIAQLSVSKVPLVTVKLAKRLVELPVDRLWLWSKVTRRAMRQIIQIPGLRVLDVFSMTGPSSLRYFAKAQSLEEFRANLYLTREDLLEVAHCPTLKEISAQGSELTPDALAAILALPQLTRLDIEATRFDDRMAKRLSSSRTIETLDIGGTPVTGIGLEYLLRMEQLRSLDLWATHITEADLPRLQDLPNLEYLSLGNYDQHVQLDADAVCQLVLQLPSIKRVWLDGIVLNTTQKAALEQKLESLRVTSLPDFSFDS